MTVLILCPLLLDRRTSVYLQGLPPAPSTPPAPLPVPVRPCLGRPWSLPRMLRILGRPHSMFPLPYGCQGRPPHHARPPGVSLPRHTRPWSCSTRCVQACLPRVLRCLFRHPVGHHQVSHPSGHPGRPTTSRTSTVVDNGSCRLPRLRPQPARLLHRPPPLLLPLPRCPKGRFLLLRQPTSTPWAHDRRAASGCLLSTTPCLSHRCRRPSVVLLPTPIGEQLWKKNTVLSYRTALGTLCLVRLGPMLSLGSGSSSTSFSLMAPSSGRRRVGFFVVLPNGLVWILMKPSALS